MVETITKNPAVSVLLRRIHEAADVSGSASVFCPHAGEAVELERCRDCDDCRGLYIDVTDRSTFLRCAFAPPEGYASGAPPTPVGASREVEMRAYGQEPVSSIMAAPVRGVPSEMSLLSLAAMFVEANISAAPVLDEAGKPIGLVSKSDLVRRFYEHGGSTESIHTRLPLTTTPALTETDHVDVVDDGTVADIMTPLVIGVRQEVPVAQAAALMAYEGVHHLIVHNASGEPVGIVSALDFLRQFAKSEGFAVSAPTRAATKEGGIC